MAQIQQALIPGLPDDIALECLSRVPHQFHAGLRPVCHRWRDTVTGSTFRRNRVTIGAAEDLVFMIQALLPENPSQNVISVDVDITDERKEDGKTTPSPCQQPTYSLALYNATLNTWQRIGTGESPVPMFAQCAVVGDKLVLVGGWDPASFDPVADVRILDLSTGEWRRGKPMSTARSFFACAAAGGRVFVAGGHDGQKNALKSAEVYDVAGDEWAALPPMTEERDECRGVVVGGMFWAVSGYGTENQGVFDSSAECYDPVKGVWTKVMDFNAAPSSTAFVYGDGMPRMWGLECGRREVREWDGEWRPVGAVPEGLVSSPCAAVMGGGERVFVMGAAAGSGGGYGAWEVEVRSRKWTPVATPAGFSGFVYSAAAVRL